MTVLILAGELDVSADQMILALRNRGVPACRIDTMWFPTRLSLDAQFREGRWRGRLRTPGRDIELEGLRSVWYRSPTTFRFPVELSDAERHHAFLEAKYGRASHRSARQPAGHGRIVTAWTALAAALADKLTMAGKLRSPEWQAALRAVPRHELVPVHYTMNPHTGAWTAENTADDLPRAYSNTALFVLPDGLSSTSMPGLMTRMLETLDVHDGHRVLEIGTGSGYNAALLCHRLGDEHVFSVDIEAELVGLARQRLAHLSYHPTLVATDGARGLPKHGPYDRIIATCSVPAVPWSWVQQTSEGGHILVDVKIGQQAGNLVLLQRRGNTAEGRFDSTFGSFMGMRRAGETYRRSAVGAQTRDCAQRRATTLDLTRPWELSTFWFFAHTTLPQATTFGLRGEGPGQPPRNTVLRAPDGSWCEVREDHEDDGTRTVWESGPHALWRIVEDAHARWCQLGRPGWGRFGLTVTAEGQSLWLDTPSSELVWTPRRAGLCSAG